MTREQVLLNKIYRAVHDLVCPACGHDMTTRPATVNGMPIRPVFWVCHHCRFEVNRRQMDEMQSAVAEWGKEPVAYFRQWMKGYP